MSTKVLIVFVALIFFASDAFAYKHWLPKRHSRYRAAPLQQSSSSSDGSIDAQSEIWAGRRKMIRFALSSSAKKQSTKVEEEEKNVAEEEEKKRKEEEEDKKIANVYAPVFIAVIGAIALRLGGRGAFVSLLGLDFVNNSGIKEQIDSLITFFQASGPNVQFAEFFLAWFVAKAFCIDPLTVILALSSGVLFSNMENPLLFGTVASVLCSSTASFICFSAFRSYVKQRDAANDTIGLLRSPIVKAIERSCGDGKGTKTVFALRLCQPIPGLPVGAYNYLFGAIKSVSPLEFLTGISVASIKPYFLDCYLGLFGKSIMDKTSGDEFTFLPILILALIVATTSLTADFATDTWKEVQAEMDAIKAEEGEEGEEGQGEGSAQRGKLKNNKSTFFTLLGIAESDLPDAVQNINRDLTQASDRLRLVIGDEWGRLCLQESDPSPASAPAPLSASSSLFSPPPPKQSSVTDNVKRILNGQQPLGPGQGGGEGDGEGKGIELFDFEKEPPGQENFKASLIESILFSFILFGSLLEYNSNS